MVNITSSFDDQNLQLTKSLTTLSERFPKSFVIIIDVSGSMSSYCNQLTRLQLVQHTMITIIETLTPDDEVIIIKFNTGASLIYKGNEKEMARNAVYQLYPDGGTNIWEAIPLAYQYANNAKNESTDILLFTDGQTEHIKQGSLNGIIEIFQDYLNNLQTKHFKLTTFGFSNDINSKLLYDMALMTNSNFCFISDQSVAASTFINFFAHHYIPHDEYSVIQISNQSDNITNFSSLSSSDKYEIVRYHVAQELENICLMTDKNKMVSQEMLIKFNKLKNYIKSFLSIIDTNLFTELYKDFESDNENEAQIYKALNNQSWFKTWGYHYLLAYSSAQHYRICHNFKDRGVQLYGSELFHDLRTKFEEMFANIPVHSSVSARVDMREAVNASNGCFSPFCHVKLFDGSIKELNDLDGSEKLHYDGVNYSTIKYIVRYHCKEPIDMAVIDNLIITPWHPIYSHDHNKWMFPNDIGQLNKYNFEYVINIVLNNGYYVIIDETKCVSLGHNLQEFDDSNIILRHPFFGTDNVISDIETFKVKSYQKIIDIMNHQIIRNIDGMVSGIVYKP